MTTEFWNVTLKDLLISGGWLLTIFGWVVSSRQANQREIRKEMRTEIDACCKMAAELLTKGRQYYTTPPTPTSSGTEAEIRFDLQRLLTRVERIEKRCAAFDVTNAGVELMDSLTGGDFESVSRQQVPHNSDLISKIESDVHFLMDALEDGFGRQFK